MSTEWWIYEKGKKKRKAKPNEIPKRLGGRGVTRGNGELITRKGAKKHGKKKT